MSQYQYITILVATLNIYISPDDVSKLVFLKIQCGEKNMIKKVALK